MTGRLAVMINVELAGGATASVFFDWLSVEHTRTATSVFLGRFIIELAWATFRFCRRLIVELTTTRATIAFFGWLFLFCDMLFIMLTSAIFVLDLRTLGFIGGLNVEDTRAACLSLTFRLAVKLAGTAAFRFTDGPPTKRTIQVSLVFTGGLPNFLRMIDV